MLPLLLAAAAPLAQLAGEEIAKLIAGDDPATAEKGAAVANALVSAAGIVAAVPVTAANAPAVAEQLAADPEKLAAFRKALGDQLVALLTLDNQDRADARQQTVELARAGSRIAWGAPVVSLVVLGTFGVVLHKVLSTPAGTSIDPNAAIMLGALTTMATAVVAYWVGSSAGSAAKDRLLRGR
jgi:hypothetical protein